MVFQYNRKLKDRSRLLRNKSTLSEVLLWNELKSRKLSYQFLRQKPLGNYIVDFYCSKLKLIIEIDGSSHDSKIEYDKFRDEFFHEMKLLVYHVLDIDVKTNLEAVVNSIREIFIRLENPPL